MSVSCIRTIEAGTKMVDLFDLYNKRALAIQLEEHYEQRQKELDYQKMQIFEFVKLREEAEKAIKPRSLDPMRRGAPKKLTEPIPSFSQSVILLLFSLMIQYRMFTAITTNLRFQ